MVINICYKRQGKNHLTEGEIFLNIVVIFQLLKKYGNAYALNSSLGFVLKAMIELVQQYG
jgi:hypothetical protein